MMPLQLIEQVKYCHLIVDGELAVTQELELSEVTVRLLLLMQCRELVKDTSANNIFIEAAHTS